MKVHYSEEQKKAIVEEFLTIYKENPKLTARKFGINKFGTSNIKFNTWVKLYDVNGIYKPINNHDRTGKSKKKSSFVEVIKTPETINSPIISSQSVRIATDYLEMSVPTNCSKKELINIFSALKEIS